MPTPAGTTALHRSLRCYVVEDSPIIRQNLIATLEEMIDVEIVGCAEDERGAIDWIHADGSDCDLRIIDLFLKSGTGLEVLRHARDHRLNARLAVLTNYATAEMRRRCEALGADRVFDKSAELEELLAYCEALAADLGGGAPA
jgi:DNA-binding NarL/FixJ family response regulator